MIHLFGNDWVGGCIKYINRLVDDNSDQLIHSEIGIISIHISDWIIFCLRNYKSVTSGMDECGMIIWMFITVTVFLTLGFLLVATSPGNIFLYGPRPWTCRKWRFSSLTFMLQTGQSNLGLLYADSASTALITSSLEKIFFLKTYIVVSIPSKSGFKIKSMYIWITLFYHNEDICLPPYITQISIDPLAIPIKF